MAESRYSLTPALDAGERAASRSSSFIAGKVRQYPLHRRLGGPDRRSGNYREDVNSLLKCTTKHWFLAAILLRLEKLKEKKLRVLLSWSHSTRDCLGSAGTRLRTQSYSVIMMLRIIKLSHITSICSLKYSLSQRPYHVVTSASPLITVVKWCLSVLCIFYVSFCVLFCVSFCVLFCVLFYVSFCVLFYVSFVYCFMYHFVYCFMYRFVYCFMYRFVYCFMYLLCIVLCIFCIVFVLFCVFLCIVFCIVLCIVLCIFCVLFYVSFVYCFVYCFMYRFVYYLCIVSLSVHSCCFPLFYKFYVFCAFCTVHCAQLYNTNQRSAQPSKLIFNFWNLDVSGSRSEIPGEFWNVVLEKDG